MHLDSRITVLPILHGRAAFARQVRGICLENRFDCIAVDLPELFEPHLADAVGQLPVIHALVAKEAVGPSYYLPIDPCDAAIEAVRQGLQQHIPFAATGAPPDVLHTPLPELPDEYAIESIGFDAYSSLCLTVIAQSPADTAAAEHGRAIASRLRTLRMRYRSILAVVHLRHVAEVVRQYRDGVADTPADTRGYSVLSEVINADHLYFALGELPFITGKYERERYDLFAPPFDPVTAVKELFRETRNDYAESQDEVTALPPVRIQAALTFLRNLTVRSGRLLPSLFDIIEAAKGVGGNSYGLRILKNAKFYPWFSVEDRDMHLGIGIDRIRIPAWSTSGPAVNLLQDHRMHWRSIELRPDPSDLRAKNYRYNWNPYGMCSHVPEDRTIERFNGTVRKKALKMMVEDLARTEKFSTSVKDGIDIRDTLRFWHTGNIYVRELPPARGKIDTVVIIFDAAHDDRYPSRTTWYAEHPEESTLTFYATDPFEHLIGPGIAKCTYGGLSLLFPPRQVPDIFQIDVPVQLPDCAARLVYGACLFSGEKTVAFVAAKKPGALITNLARSRGKRLFWIPLAHFSHETVRKLRQFHILNGKTVRSWAGRFIGD